MDKCVFVFGRKVSFVHCLFWREKHTQQHLIRREWAYTSTHFRAHEKSKCTYSRKHERGEVQNDVVRSVYLISVLSAVWCWHIQN